MLAMEASVLKGINYIWRLIATAISFSLFGIGGLLLTVLVFPMLNLLYKDIDTRKRYSRKIIHKSFGMFVGMMSFFRMFDFDIDQNKDRLIKTRGKIIIANHPTLIDVVVLLAILPHADCIVKQSLWSNPFLNGVVNAAGYIKNTQDTEALLKACKRTLDEGYALVIFPEGTRTDKSANFKIQRGASNIAIRCDSDLVPVTIQCKPTTLTKTEAWYQIPNEKAHFLLRVGKDIKIKDFQLSNLSPSIKARRLTSYIKEYFIGENERYART